MKSEKSDRRTPGTFLQSKSNFFQTERYET